MLQFLVVRVSYCVPARPAGENNAPIIRPKIPPNKRPASPRVYNKWWSKKRVVGPADQIMPRNQEASVAASGHQHQRIKPPGVTILTQESWFKIFIDILMSFNKWLWWWWWCVVMTVRAPPPPAGCSTSATSQLCYLPASYEYHRLPGLSCLPACPHHPPVCTSFQLSKLCVSGVWIIAGLCRVLSLPTHQGRARLGSPNTGTNIHTQ